MKTEAIFAALRLAGSVFFRVAVLLWRCLVSGGGVGSLLTRRFRGRWAWGFGVVCGVVIS